MAPKVSPAKTATPKGKGAKALLRTTDLATPDMPKKQKLNFEGAAKAVVAGADAVKPAESEKVESPIRLAAHDETKQSGIAEPANAAIAFWNGPAGPDPKSLSSPAFDPELRIAEFPRGKAVGFALVSGALKDIEALKGSGSGSRKKTTVILSNLFRVLMFSKPEDLAISVYILTNKVAPDYEESELGIGDATLIQTMSEVFGRSAAVIKQTLESGEASDLGEVALLSRVSQKQLFLPPKLTIEKVFAEMKAIATASGKDSQKSKKDKILKLLVASRDEEAKYIVRLMQGKLRCGIQLPTILQALAYAFVLTTPGKKGGEPCGDVRKVKGRGRPSTSVIDGRMVSMEEAVRQSFCELPNIDRLVAALLDGRDGSTLAEACHISLGIPVKPMLAKPSKGIPEVIERLTGKRFTGEWKYDGERAQIHVVSRDNILVYSRNSENMTEKYPDVIKVVKECLSDEVESCIIDSEVVAFDVENDRILPFQVLSTRKRKEANVDDLKVQVCIYAFDCMLFNGTPLLKETFEARRQRLWKTLKEVHGKVTYATYRNFDEVEEENIQAFLDESIAGSCEGLMLKTLVDNALYQPSKRSLNWLKLKKDYMDGIGDTLDVVPIGAYFGRGKRTGTYGAFLLAVYDQESEEFQTVCKAGTGFSDEDLTTHFAFFKDHLVANAESNYNVSDKLTPDVWLEACQVWEIKAADLSISPVHTSAMGVKADGKGIGLRFPRFLRIRDDKAPEDATSADQIVDMYESQASVAAAAGGGDDDEW